MKGNCFLKNSCLVEEIISQDAMNNFTRWPSIDHVLPRFKIPPRRNAMPRDLHSSHNQCYWVRGVKGWDQNSSNSQKTFFSINTLKGIFWKLSLIMWSFGIHNIKENFFARKEFSSFCKKGVFEFLLDWRLERQFYQLLWIAISNILW